MTSGMGSLQLKGPGPLPRSPVLGSWPCRHPVASYAEEGVFPTRQTALQSRKTPWQLVGLLEQGHLGI